MRVITDKLRQSVRALPPVAILGAAWLWLLVYAYPGVMTMDSFDQLREGREWSFSDSHPPIMAALWGILDRIVPGPFTMLVIQSGTFLAGVFLILRRTMTPRRAAIAASLVFVYPPVFCTFAVIWKDCLMAGALVLGIAWVLDERRRIRVLGLVAFTIATALRYNALAATLSLVVLLFQWELGKRWYVRYSIALATWLAITVIALGSNALLTDRKMDFWQQSLALQDIAGVLAFVDDDIPDAELHPLLAPTEIDVDAHIHAAVRAKYKSNDFQQLISGDGQLWHVAWTEPLPKPRRDAITHAWWTLVSQHPGAYLRYRLENFGETLGVNKRFGGAMVVPHRAQYKGMLEYFGFAAGDSTLQRHVEDAYMWLSKHTRMWRPHLYALLALALLGFCRRHPDVLAILLSGLFMELTMLVLGGTPDYRYSHWLVVSACLALVILIARRSRGDDMTRGSARAADHPGL